MLQIEKKNVVFVYGTLMKGEKAAHLMEKAQFLGPATLSGYACYNLISYPGIKKNEKGIVYGELYAVDDTELAFLDQYEDEGVEYKRITVDVDANGEKLSAMVYKYIPEKVGDKVDGRWRQ